MFKGLFAVIELPKGISEKITFRADKGKLHKVLFKELFVKSTPQVSIDSDEFEKYFDVFAENKLLAMRIFTSDVIQYILYLKKQTGYNFEFTISNRTLYIRIHCSNMFEAPENKKAIDYKTLENYYQHLDFVSKLATMFCKSIERKDF